VAKFRVPLQQKAKVVQPLYPDKVVAEDLCPRCDVKTVSRGFTVRLVLFGKIANTAFE
jgi:hypothetical protein